MVNWINPLNTAYNVPSTVIIGILFCFGSMIGFLIFKKLRIKINLKFFLSVSPYILFFAVVRVLRDAEIIRSFLFTSPYFYILSGIFLLFAFLSAIFLERKFRIPYSKLMFVSGIILFSLSIFQINFINLPALAIFLILLPSLAVIFLVRTNLENKIALASQVFDGIVTASSIEWFGYAEKHILPTLIITVNPFLFPVVKILVVILILLFVDKNVRDEELRNYVKYLIAIVGLLTGTRDFLRVLALV